MGWRENEYGEIVKKRSKAEARRNLLNLKIALVMTEQDIVASICKRARDEICAIEDALVFSQISSISSMEVPFTHELITPL